MRGEFVGSGTPSAHRWRGWGSPPQGRLSTDQRARGPLRRMNRLSCQGAREELGPCAQRPLWLATARCHGPPPAVSAPIGPARLTRHARHCCVSESQTSGQSALIGDLESLRGGLGLDQAGTLESSTPDLVRALQEFDEWDSNWSAVDMLHEVIDRLAACPPEAVGLARYPERPKPTPADVAAVVRMAINADGSNLSIMNRRRAFTIPDTIRTYYKVRSVTTSRWRTAVEADAFEVLAAFLDRERGLDGSPIGDVFSQSAGSPARGALFGNPATREVDIVCSEIPRKERPAHASPRDRNYLRYSRFADLDSFVYLRTQLSRLYPNAHITDYVASEYPERDPDLLVVVGGPPWNRVFREYARDLPFRFVAHPLGIDDPLLVDGVAGELCPGYKRGRVVSDVALVIRLNCGPGKWVWMFGGCLTLGVLGASTAFLDATVAPGNARWLSERIDGDESFILCFRVHKTPHSVVAPSFDQAPPIALLTAGTSGTAYELRHLASAES